MEDKNKKRLKLALIIIEASIWIWLLWTVRTVQLQMTDICDNVKKLCWQDYYCFPMYDETMKPKLINDISQITSSEDSMPPIGENFWTP